MLVAALAVSAQRNFEVPLYPDGMTDSNGIKEQEEWADGRVSKVSVPSLYVYLPEQTTPKTPVVIICPGGGYLRLAIEHEGFAAARWLNSRGYAAVVLKYRMPNGRSAIPLRDAHKAILTVREKAAEWGLDPAKVGIMGCSAGGHLASTAATHFDDATRPDFAVLLYPVVTMTNYTHAGSKVRLLGDLADPGLVRLYSNESQVKDNTPPLFIALSDDDRSVPPLNSTALYNAAKVRGIERCEMHIYPTGGHGWGFKEDFAYKDEFRTALGRWLDWIVKK